MVYIKIMKPMSFFVVLHKIKHKCIFVSFEDMRRLLKGHMPILDALRGIAILMVIFHNIGYTGHKAVEGSVAKIFSLISDLGWMGVQLFFVLSGFLITGILFDGHKKCYQIRNFYIRRILRIFPIYYIFLSIVMVVLPYIGFTPEWLSNAQIHQWSYWCYLSNWVYPFMNPINLGHLWSLSVEEQFYIIWPLLVIFMSRNKLIFTCFILILVAVFARLIISSINPVFADNAIYAFTITRCDALAVGALFAITMRDRILFNKLKIIAPGIFISSGLIFFFQLLLKHTFSPIEKGFGVINALAAAVITSTTIYYGLMLPKLFQRSSCISRLSSALQIIGKYSYAMYIFHIQVKYIWISKTGLNVTDTGLNGLRLAFVMSFNSLCVFSISFILSFISWHAIEHPLIKLKKYFSGVST